MTGDGPLAGIRILDCGNWTGAFAARILADGGADVVRVVPSDGDQLDREPPFFADSGTSIQAAWYNAGKRVIQLDLSTADAQDALLGLATGADILIDDWIAGHEQVPLAQLRRANPALTRVTVSPMGSSGPHAGLQVNDLVANALCGSASVTGRPDTPPLTGYGNQTVHTAGLYAAFCALAAFRAAEATGSGVHVDLSAHEALASCTEQIFMEWFFPSQWPTPVAPRQGSLHWSGAYDVFPAGDGIGVMVTAALQFGTSLLPWIQADGAAQALGDPTKFPSVADMLANRPYVMQVMKDWTATKDSHEFFLEAQRRHQPFAPAWDIATAAKSPQIAAREYIREVPTSGPGHVAMPGRLFRTDADEGHPRPATMIASAAEITWDARRGREPAIPVVAGLTAQQPLAGVRILDFTHVLAGPFGTRMLGDLGAEVIKIGTGARSAGANGPAHGYYMSWNRNKKHVTLNMAEPGGRAVARELALKSDVVIENFSAGVLARWGLDRPSLAQDNPGISVVSLGGMGQTGPWKDFVTFAPTIHALCGLTYLTNFAPAPPLGYGFSLTDHLSGIAGAVACLEGLRHRARTGQGLAVDVSQYELGLGMMAPALMDHLSNGKNPQPCGNAHPFSEWAPHGIYRAQGDDRWVAIAVRGDAQFDALCAVMGRPGLASDGRFAVHSARIANLPALDAEIEGWTAGLDRYDVMHRCQAAGIAAGAVQDAADLAERDPQIAARGFFGTAHTERWGDYGVDRFPALFNGVRPDRYEGVHEVGEDTFAVLSELLGLDDSAIASLAAAGALA